jgi:hypothetical protein
MLQRGARPGVGADAHTDRGTCSGCSRSCTSSVAASAWRGRRRADGGALEQAEPSAAAPGSRAAGPRCTGVPGRKPASARTVSHPVALQAFDADGAAAVQRAAVDDQEQPRALLRVGSTSAAGAAPGGAGIAGAAHADRRGRLGVAPGLVAELAAGGQGQAARRSSSTPRRSHHRPAGPLPARPGPRASTRVMRTRGPGVTCSRTSRAGRGRWPAGAPPAAGEK